MTDKLSNLQDALKAVQAYRLSKLQEIASFLVTDMEESRKKLAELFTDIEAIETEMAGPKSDVYELAKSLKDQYGSSALSRVNSLLQQYGVTVNGNAGIPMMSGF